MGKLRRVANGTVEAEADQSFASIKYCQSGRTICIAILDIPSAINGQLHFGVSKSPDARIIALSTIVRDVQTSHYIFSGCVMNSIAYYST